MRTHAHAHPEAVSNPVTAAHAEAAALVLLERRQEHHALKQATPQHAAEGADLVAVPRAAHGGGAAAAGALRLEAVREAVTAKAKATAEEATAVVQAPETTHHAEVTACAVRRRMPHALGKRRAGRTRGAETEATEGVGSRVDVVAHQTAHHHVLEQLAPATAAARLPVRLGLGLGRGLVLVGGLVLLGSGGTVSAPLPALRAGRLERGLAGKPGLAPYGPALAVALRIGRRGGGCGSKDQTKRLLSLLGEFHCLDQIGIAGHGDEVVLIVDVPDLELGRIDVVHLAQQALELSKGRALAQSETAEITIEVTLHDDRHRC